MIDLLKKVFPLSTEANRRKFAFVLELAMLRYGITTINRKRAFLAQIGHESGQLSRTTENLNYSAAGLRKVFGNYFRTDAIAAQYAHKPDMIANAVYANRLGNGNYNSGDGFRYRGRGLIQLTGKANYAEATRNMYALPMGVDFVDDPDLLATPEYAAQSACWFWQKAGLNELADKLAETEAEMFKAITKRINGGYNGLADRIELYNLAKKTIV